MVQPLANLDGLKPTLFVLTGDRARALPFYRDTLGLPLIAEDPFAATFDLGGTEMRLTDIAGHVAGPHTVAGWDVPDIVAMVDALVARGVAFQHYEGFGQDERGIWSAPDGGARIAWFTDPDGNVLSLHQRG